MNANKENAFCINDAYKKECKKKEETKSNLPQNAMIHCCRKTAGCTWVGRFEEFQSHWQECLFCLILCECNKFIERRALPQHKIDGCSKQEKLSSEKESMHILTINSNDIESQKAIPPLPLFPKSDSFIQILCPTCFLHINRSLLEVNYLVYEPDYCFQRSILRPAK